MAKKRLLIHLILTAMSHLTNAEAKILRNNALMNKMVSHFQKDNNYLSAEHKTQKESDEADVSPKSEKVMSLMQNVLCRNFPTIPCRMITEDETLRKLIEKSIQQIKYKTLISIDKTTATPGYHLSLFPTINSEELSNFLQIRSPTNGFYDKRNVHEDVINKSKKQKKSIGDYWSQEKTQKSTNKNKRDSKRTTVYNGRKKLRKFYPHKIKYKDKSKDAAKKDFGDYSEEKLSMSVEIPDMTLTKRHEHLSYKVEPADPAVWRIDYMKHGEPSLNNLMGYEDDRLRGKLVKTGPSVIVDETVLEQGARKDVMHPDVYIKKNYLRKNPVEINNSENME